MRGWVRIRGRRGGERSVFLEESELFESTDGVGGVIHLIGILARSMHVFFYAWIGVCEHFLPAG